MVTGLDIIQSAEKYKGVPYFEGNPQGVPPAAKGFDCSGLVQRALADLGIQISRTTTSQFADAVVSGKTIGTDLSKAQQGDIIHYVGHEEIWIGGPNNQVFSESVPGEVADIRGRTPWPIVGIVRYADGGAGPIGGTITNGKTNATDPVSSLVMNILQSTGLLDVAKQVAAIGHFLNEATSANFWARVGLAFLGLVCLALGLYGLSKHANVITVTSQMVKKGAEVASSS